MCVVEREKERERERERELSVLQKEQLYMILHQRKNIHFLFAKKKVGILAFFLNDVLKIFFVFVLFIYLGKMVILWQNCGRIMAELSQNFLFLWQNFNRIFCFCGSDCHRIYEKNGRNLG